MPVYKKGKNKWRVRIWVNGVRQPDETFEGTMAEARAHEARRRVELEKGAAPVSNWAVPTFRDFCIETYKGHAVAHLKSGTWRNRTYQLARLIEVFGSLKLTDFSTARIEAFKDMRLRGGVRAAATNDDLKVLRAVLQYAEDLEIPCRIPKWKHLVERNTRRAQAWTQVEVGTLLDACARVSPEILPMVVFLANTGCRKGEALALRTASVDLDNRLVRVEPTADWSPKNNKPREVPIGDALRPWMQPERLGAVWAFPCPKTGGRWACWPERAWNRAVKAAGLTGGPHRLRHAYASHLVQRTSDLFLVARMLGHSHSRVTEVYAHLLPEALDRARAAVDFPASVTPAMLEAKRRWNIGGAA